LGCSGPVGQFEVQGRHGREGRQGLARFWVSIRSYKKQPVKKCWCRILDLAWLKFAGAALKLIYQGALLFENLKFRVRQSIPESRLLQDSERTDASLVKLGNKERFDKLVLRNHYPCPNANLLHKDKELLALRKNFRVTKKFLITKFDCTTEIDK
jgi:hypothetical protein